MYETVASAYTLYHKEQFYSILLEDSFYPYTVL